VQIHVAAAAVVGSEMKDRVDSLHHGARNARLAQVGANELDLPSGDVAGNVAQVPLVKSSTTRIFAPRSIN